jgi:hypothetical protein
MDSKNLFQSKTVWVSILTGLLSATSPYIQSFISEHPGWAGISVSIVFTVLRFISSQPVELFKKNE